MKYIFSILGLISGIILLVLGFNSYTWGHHELSLKTIYYYIWFILMFISVVAFFQDFRQVKELKKFKKNWYGSSIGKKKKLKGIRLKKRAHLGKSVSHNFNYPSSRRMRG